MKCEGISGVVQFGKQTAFSDNIGGAMYFFGSQVSGCGHGVGKNIFVLYVKAHLAEFVTNIPVCALTVVGEEQKWIASVAKAINEFHGPGYGFAAFVDHSVHVNEKAFLFHSKPFLFK